MSSKLKTRRSAAKRFRFTGTGKVVRNHAGHRHNLTGQPKSAKLRQRKRTWSLRPTSGWSGACCRTAARRSSGRADMARIKRGVTAKARHKEVLAQAKGYRGRSKNCYRLALRRVEKGLQYAYRDRRNRKRDFRSLWIQRINAAARMEGLTYGQMIHGLKTAGVEIDRKVLADLAVRDQAGFTSLAKRAQAALVG